MYVLQLSLLGGFDVLGVVCVWLCNPSVVLQLQGALFERSVLRDHSSALSERVSAMTVGSALALA